MEQAPRKERRRSKTWEAVHVTPESSVCSLSDIGTIRLAADPGALFLEDRSELLVGSAPNNMRLGAAGVGEKH